MRLHKFTWMTIDDPELGEMTGWIGHPHYENFDPALGFGICHDIFEEFECPKYKQSGQPFNELLAFGAMYYIRAENGWFHKNRGFQTAVENMSASWSEIFDHAIEQNMGMKIPPITRPLQNEDAEDDFQEMCRKGEKSLIDELEYFNEDAEQLAEDIKRVKEHTQWAIHWLRIGYRRAQKRYQNTDGYEICIMFENITEEIRDIEKRKPEEGDEMHILTDFKNSRYKVRSIPVYETKEYRRQYREEARMYGW